jgi:hypothetical protein
VRQLYRFWQSANLARKDTETRQIWRLFAVLVESLQTEANPQKRHVSPNRIDERRTQTTLVKALN